MAGFKSPGASVVVKVETEERREDDKEDDDEEDRSWFTCGADVGTRDACEIAEMKILISFVKFEPWIS